MEIEFTFISNNKRFLKKNFFDFLSEGLENILSLNKYDYKEPVKRNLHVDNFDNVLEILNNYSGIILKGKNKSFITSQISNLGITYWSGSIILKENQIYQITDLIKLIEKFSFNNQLLFAFITEKEEFEFKHRVTTEHSYGWDGVSLHNFLNFLPGVYWYTFFGSDLVNTIGKEKLQTLKGVKYSENLNDDNIAFHLNEPITSDSEDRIEIENNIALQIGNFFYNKKDKSYKHHEKFKLYLDTLK
ncbi:hypothetical protein [Flavobacterium coralii]|uniref:hypothetical protein n=1 Tax=Flavobacterium coralii TaxID=2838017 RepID=UPI000C63C537|nr:hypothetical protein [Flavobacterium sp.]|tara:strand:- start:429 stop:1163 length:735 start_codon:yes stop_codon:yes gene_type:complete